MIGARGEAEDEQTLNAAEQRRVRRDCTPRLVASCSSTV
jgi:hypothetical protein